MKSTKKTPKLPLIEASLLMVIIGLIGFVAWYVYHVRQASNELLQQANESSQQTYTTPKSNLNVTPTKLPSGWTVSEKTGTYAELSGGNSCVASVTYAPQTAATGQAAVRSLGTSRQILQTTDGEVPLTVNVSQTGTGSLARYQTTGTVSGGVQEATVTTNCPKQTDLTAAAQALQAITINTKPSF